MSHILVIRLSSMGDVLLTAPVLRGALEADPGLTIDLLTRKQFTGYFQNIERLRCIPVDTQGIHRGLSGLLRLSREIRINSKPDILLDLHNVLRSRILSLLLAFRGTSSYRIDKGRREKKAYISDKNRSRLKHTTRRYQDVFVKADIEAPLVGFPLIKRSSQDSKVHGNCIKLGLAPFARHKAKSWPLESSIQLMRLLSRDKDISFHIYGGKMDAERLAGADLTGLNVKIHAGKLDPAEEIISISGLDIFLSMDSANMHLADLTGIPVVSLWGGTHPDLGFRPFNQPDNHAIISSETIPCQPCSVFGKKECYLKEGKYKCLTTISPQEVMSKIITVLGL